MKAVAGHRDLPILLFDWFAFHLLKYNLGSYNQLYFQQKYVPVKGKCVFSSQTENPGQSYSPVPKQQIH